MNPAHEKLQQEIHRLASDVRVAAVGLSPTLKLLATELADLRQFHETLSRAVLWLYLQETGRAVPQREAVPAIADIANRLLATGKDEDRELAKQMARELRNAHVT